MPAKHVRRKAVSRSASQGSSLSGLLEQFFAMFKKKEETPPPRVSRSAEQSIPPP